MKYAFHFFALFFVCFVFISCPTDVSEREQSLKKETRKSDPFIESIIDKNANPAIDFYKYSVGTWLQENPVNESNPSIIYGEDNCGDKWFENFKKTGGEPVYDELKRLFENYKQYEDVEFYKNHLDAIDNAKTIQDCLRELEIIHQDGMYPLASYSLTQVGNKFCININSLMGVFIFYKNVFKYLDNNLESKTTINNFLRSIDYEKEIDAIISGVLNSKIYCPFCMKKKDIQKLF